MGGASSGRSFEIGNPKVLAGMGGTVSLEIPATVAAMLEREARARRKSITYVMAEWLQDRADERAALKVLKRIESGEEKTHDAAEVWKRLGI